MKKLWNELRSKVHNVLINGSTLAGITLMVSVIITCLSVLTGLVFTIVSLVGPIGIPVTILGLALTRLFILVAFDK